MKTGKDQKLMCVNKMNGPTRLKLYLIIARRDEEFCRGCHKLPNEKQLVIGHVDNNNANNQLGMDMTVDMIGKSTTIWKKESEMNHCVF